MGGRTDPAAERLPGVEGPRAPLFNVLHNKLYEEETQRPALAAGLLGSDRIWFASQASFEPLTSDTVRRLAARAEAAGGPPVILADPGKAIGENAKMLVTPGGFAPICLVAGATPAGRADSDSPSPL